MDLSAFKLGSRGEFDCWFARDYDHRRELYQLMGVALGVDPASLNELESYLLSRYASPRAALILGEREILDAAARHIGLVMVMSVDGARWDIDLQHGSPYYGYPVTRLADGAAECPLTLAATCLDLRSGRFLAGLVALHQQDYRGAYAS